MRWSLLKHRAGILSEQLSRAFRFQQSSETLSLILSAVAIGVLVGFAAVAFDFLVDHLDTLVHQARVSLGVVWGPLVIVLIPTLGGLLITPIVLWWSPDVRGSGIPFVMLAVSNLGGRVPKRVAFWRPLASMLSIGTGASLGTEGPVVQIGASIASTVSDVLKLNDERRRTLVAVAAAGGVAATFNAPIAGVLFALEVVLGQFGNKYFASVVIGAVAASAVSRAYLGADPAFRVPAYTLESPFELPLYFLLGLFCALVSVVFIRIIVIGEDLFNASTGAGRLRISPWLRPTVGGLLIGILGLLMPGVLGRGYDVTGAILQSQVAGYGFLFLLAFLKMVATSVSLASWASGGIFAPALLIGAASGGAFAQLFAQWGYAVNAGAFALVGMGAVFAGVTRAPISTIVMIFEMSGSYSLILPLLLAAVVATLVADVFHPESAYQMILSRRGLSLLRARETDILQTVNVSEVMDEDVPRLFADETMKDLQEELLQSHHHGFIVTLREQPEHLVGIVTLADLERARQANVPPDATVYGICSKTVHCALPDEPISEVLERMAQYGIGRMPVVHPKDRRKPIGFVRQSDLARAYYRAVQRERQLEEDEEARRLRDLTGQEIVEVRVKAGTALAGKTLREARLPKESIVVAIRRRGKTVFPHGDTTLEVGDTVVANVAPGFSSTFRGFFLNPKEKEDV